jgi:hypothetical protein
MAGLNAAQPLQLGFHCGNETCPSVLVWRRAQQIYKIRHAFRGLVIAWAMVEANLAFIASFSVSGPVPSAGAHPTSGPC